MNAYPVVTLLRWDAESTRNLQGPAAVRGVPINSIASVIAGIIYLPGKTARKHTGSHIKLHIGN